MTEVFTTGPHICGKYDPTISLSGNGAELPTDHLVFYCTLRNMYGIFASSIAILGIIGNVISLIILPKTGVARSAIVFLECLGVYDTAFLISGFFLRTLPSITIIGHFGIVLSNALSPIMFPLAHISHVGAIYSTICISGERCIAVACPLKAMRILTLNRVKKVAAVIFVWSILFNIPRYMMLEPKEYWEASLNHTWIRLEPTEHSDSVTLVFLFFGYVNTIVKVVIPLLLVGFLNIILLCYLHHRHNYLFQQVRTSPPEVQRLHYNRAHGSEFGGSSERFRFGNRKHLSSSNRVTSVVLAITGIFWLSQLFAGSEVLIYLFGYDKDCGQPCAVFTQLCDTVYILVSATNFLLYYAFGEKFRTIIRTYRCCRAKTSVESMLPGTPRESTAISLRTNRASNGDFSADNYNSNDMSCSMDTRHEFCKDN